MAPRIDPAGVPGREEAYLKAYGVDPDPERIRYYRELWDMERPTSSRSVGGGEARVPTYVWPRPPPSVNWLGRGDDPCPGSQQYPGGCDVRLECGRDSLTDAGSHLRVAIAQQCLAHPG